MRFLPLLIFAAITLVALPAFATEPPPLTGDEVSKVVELLRAHAWVPVSAIIIGLVVRLLKSDTKIPIDIPGRYRTPLVYVLALLAGVLEKVATGSAWLPALVNGALAGLFAQQGHLLVIDSLRSGKELAIPGLIVPGAAPAPGKPITVRPPPLPLLVLALFALVLAGCSAFFKALDLAADKAACVVANQDLPNSSIFVKCAIENPEGYLELLAESRASTKRALARQAAPSPASVCGDAGLDAAAEVGK